MSSFNRSLDVRKVKSPTGRLWMVLRDFTYHVGSLQSDDTIVVPQGFLTDFASVPRFFWRIIPPDGEYTQAAVLHDFLYSIQDRERKASDKIFLEAMSVLEVPKWKRGVMYRAVRYFGWLAWKNKLKGTINVGRINK